MKALFLCLVICVPAAALIAADDPYEAALSLLPQQHSRRTPRVTPLTLEQTEQIALQANPETEYVDRISVANEVNDSRRMFAERDWPIIDVSRRSIEETAAAILRLLARSRGEET